MNDSAAPGTTGRLVSGEAVELDVRVARIGSRALAFVVDFFIMAVFTAMMVALGTAIGVAVTRTGAGDAALSQAIWVVSLVLGVVGYPAAVETLTKGRSVGKAMMGLRVVCDDGGPIRFRHALARALVGAAIEVPGLLLPGLAWLVTIGVMVVHPSGKRVGDIMAGTIVIHERTAENRTWVAVMPPGLQGWASVCDLTRLDDRLALAVRHFLSRNHDIAEPARTRLGTALAAEAMKVVTPAPPPGTPGWAYLAALLAERRRRSASRLAANRAVTAQVWDTLYGTSRASGARSWLPGPVPGSEPGRIDPWPNNRIHI